MAHFIFNEYVGKLTNGSDDLVPVKSTSNVGVVLVDDDQLDATSTWAAVKTHVANDTIRGSNVLACVPTSVVVTTVAPESGSASITEVRSDHVEFGEDPSRTTITARGCVVFVSESPISTSVVPENAFPVCFLDFGDTVSSNSAPFAITFNGGDRTATPETKGVVFRYKQSV